MLAKKYRLIKKKDFEKTFKQGRFLKNNFFNIRIIENNLEISRFGFVVSLKVSKKATERNKTRRRLQESIGLKIEQIKSGFDIVIMAKPEIKSKSWAEIDNQLETILKQGGLME